MSVASEYMGAMLAGQQFQSGQLKQQQEKQTMDFMAQEEPARLQTLQADAQLKQLSVNIQKRQEAASQAFADLMRKQNAQRAEGAATGPGVTGSGPASPSDMLTEQADVLFQYGLGSDAVATLKDAADLDSKQATTAKTKAENFRTQTSDFRDFLNPDNGPVSASDLQTYVLQNHPDLLADPKIKQAAQQIAQNPASWTPELQKQVFDRLTTEQQRLDAQYKKSQTVHEAAETRAAEARTQLDRANAGFDVVSEAAHTKAGDPPTEGPSLDAIRAAYLTTPGAVIPPGGLAQQNAFFRALRKENPGVTDAKALVQLTVGAGGRSSTGGLGGASVIQQNERVIAASKALSGALHSITRLPVTVSSGALLGGDEHASSFLGLSKRYAGYKMTPESDQIYQQITYGLGRFAAAIEGVGSATGMVGITKSLQDQISFKPGETVSAKVMALADIKENADNVLDVIQSNPQVPKPLRDKITDIRAQLQQTIPYSRDDVEDFFLAKGGKGNETFQQFVDRQHGKQSTTPKPYVDPGKEARYQQWKKDHGFQ